MYVSPTTFLTRQEIGKFFHLDGRTVCARFAVEPDGVLIQGGQEILIYALEKITALAKTVNDQYAPDNSLTKRAI
jgi:hypothetical protein